MGCHLPKSEIDCVADFKTSRCCLKFRKRNFNLEGLHVDFYESFENLAVKCSRSIVTDCTCLTCSAWHLQGQCASFACGYIFTRRKCLRNNDVSELVLLCTYFCAICEGGLSSPDYHLSHLQNFSAGRAALSKNEHDVVVPQRSCGCGVR
jgi:hypothetical protein